MTEHVNYGIIGISWSIPKVDLWDKRMKRDKPLYDNHSPHLLATVGGVTWGNIKDEISKLEERYSIVANKFEQNGISIPINWLAFLRVKRY